VLIATGVGVLVGSVGVGGILLRQGSIKWSSGLWLCAGALPGAWMGATLVNKITAEWVTLIIATVVIFAAFNSIRAEQTKNRKQPSDNESARSTDAI